MKTRVGGAHARYGSGLAVGEAHDDERLGGGASVGSWSRLRWSKSAGDVVRSADIADGDAVFGGPGGGADEFTVADLRAQGVGGPFAVVGKRGVLDGASAVPVGLGEGLLLGDVLGDEVEGEGEGEGERYKQERQS